MRGIDIDKGLDGAMGLGLFGGGGGCRGGGEVGGDVGVLRAGDSNVTMRVYTEMIMTAGEIWAITRFKFDII